MRGGYNTLQPQCKARLVLLSPCHDREQQSAQLWHEEISRRQHPGTLRLRALDPLSYT